MLESEFVFVSSDVFDDSTDEESLLESEFVFVSSDFSELPSVFEFDDSTDEESEFVVPSIILMDTFLLKESLIFLELSAFAIINAVNKKTMIAFIFIYYFFLFLLFILNLISNIIYCILLIPRYSIKYSVNLIGSLSSNSLSFNHFFIAISFSFKANLNNDVLSFKTAFWNKKPIT